MSVKVSVIVPVYNVEKHLEKCLESLAAQTLQEIEIIVVNDGSPDNSQGIIEDFEKRYPEKIKGYLKENGGLSDARNFGVKEAVGEYIGFVDSDDYVDADMFQALYQKAVSENAEVVISPISYEFERRVSKRFLRDEDIFGKSVLESPSILNYAESYAHIKLYNRKFWISEGFVFPFGKWFEDSAIIYNVLLAANKVSLVNFPYYHYNCRRSDSITTTFNDKIFHIFDSCNSIIEYFKSRNAYEPLYAQVELLCVKHIFARFVGLSNCSDKKLIKRFLNSAFAFLNTNFPNWKESQYFPKATKSRLTKLKHYAGRHQKILEFYLCLPKSVRRRFRKALSFGLRAVKRVFKGSAKKRTEKINEKKRIKIKKYGLKQIEEVQAILSKLGISSFADFGTLLGIVREGKLLSHDIDIDIGVFLNGRSYDDIRSAMEKEGYSLWRQYRFGEKVVEESYLFDGIKIDFNYYELTEEYSKTWLFYRIPGKSYPDNTRNIVEMRYSPITSFEEIVVEGHNINIPANALQILEEKYGKSWRTPDKKWIYWESPSAVKLEDIGYFVNYKYLNRPVPQKVSDRLQKQISKLQKYELKVLLETVSVCDKLGLKYYLGEGTLLGAVRHGGFIPWDDDVDILMPREDYDKFLKLAPAHLSKDFLIQHWTVTPKYWSVFMKVRYIKPQSFYQKPIAHLTKNNGPYIDIFPLDEVPELYSPAQRRQKVNLNRLRKALSYKRGDTKPKGRKIKGNILRVLGKLAPAKLLYNAIEKNYRKFSNQSCQYYVNLASYYSANKQTFPKEYYGEGKFLSFEGHEFRVPEAYDKILNSIYGDYLKLPPMNQRKFKHSFQKKVD